MAVVAHHTNWTKTVVGASGVDLFLVISGFVMTYVGQTDQTPIRFLRARALRIIPLYWIATLLTAAIEQVTDPWYIIGSLIFWSHKGPHGSGYPVVISGWTLNLEAVFYVIFAATLMLSSKPRMVILSVGLCGLGVLGMILHPGIIASTNIINCLFLEFLGGIWLCKAWQRGWLRFAGPFLLVGFAALIAQAGLVQEPTTWRWLVWGGPALLIVAGMLGLEQVSWLPRLSSLLVLGDASYAIYLTHMLVLQAVGVMLRPLPALIALPLVASCCVAVGWLTHVCVEAPIKRWTSGVKLSTTKRSVFPNT